jgi:putative ABC transport system permease protein
MARLRAAFVSGQFGLAMLLLVVAGLLARSFIKLRSIEPGFDPVNVLSVAVSLPAARYPDGTAIRAFHAELEEALGAIPGIRDVGTVSAFFLSERSGSDGIMVEGRPELVERTQAFPVVQDVASSGFFRTAGMAIVAGRGFTEADGAESRPVAVVNETFVRIYLEGVDPLGRRFVWGGPPDADSSWITIVGVVADARRSGLDRLVRPTGFVPAPQDPLRRMDILVRTAGSDPLGAVPAVRRVISGIDPELPLTRVRTLDQAMSDALAQRRFVVTVLSIFAAAALALAAIGIFGVMAYLVGQRTREIGIRVALGAPRQALLGRIFAEGLVHAGIGLALGLMASLALTRFVRSQLFGLEPSDPATFAGAAAVLLATAMLACWVPARRASHVDPMVALREE